MDSLQLEENIIESFRLAKKDIIRLQNSYTTISENQRKIIDLLRKLETTDEKLFQKLKDLAKKASKIEPMERRLTKKIEQVNKKASKKPKVLTRTIKKTAPKRAVKTFIATKDGKKFHIKQCPFAQNITPKNKLTFKTKTKALNQGLKPCRCVK